MTVKLSPKHITSFQNEILSWYEKNKRDLPWRHTRNPYKILISEVMSQQTQLSRVVPKYLAWMERFPTLKDLAKAPTSDILKYWSGLGYNRRALYLKKLAEELMLRSSLQAEIKQNNSTNRLAHKQDLLAMTVEETIWPQTEKELQQLPGIGEYTTRALLCFAFDKQIAVVDTNVRKVILTQFSISNYQFSKQEIQQIAEQLLPKGRAYDWNQALMDYAASVLKQQKIPIPRQSKFQYSDRYYRGQIIKLLLEKDSFLEKEIFKTFEQELGSERFEKIVKSLVKDGFVLREKEHIVLI